MIDERQVFERVMRGFVPPDDSLERLVRRRDRKRRNERIAAGVVGIAVFVAAVWIVTSVSSLDRSETSVFPGGSGTSGPAETGPTQTGPTGPHDSGWDGAGLPPEGAVESTPVEGETVHWFVSSGSSTMVIVYADGRVLSRKDAAHGPFLERRLTPEGLELVLRMRPGAIFPDFPDSVDPATEIPTDAWADAEARPYVAPRYAICARPTDDASQLPERAQALLQGKERTWEHAAGDMDLVTVTCYVVTTDEARAVADVLERAGFDGAEGYIGDVEFSLPDAKGGLRFEPLLPNGDYVDVTGPTETGTDGDRTGGDPPPDSWGVTIVTHGACSDGAQWQRELQDQGHQIEMLFEVWRSPVGHTWRIVLRHVAPLREHVFFRGTSVAAADPDVQFVVVGRDRDWPGIERFQARAVDTQTGQVCTAGGGGRF
jgi:hypothetical protein